MRGAVGVRCLWVSAAVRWLEGYRPLDLNDDVDPTLRYRSTGVRVGEGESVSTIAEEG